MLAAALESSFCTMMETAVQEPRCCESEILGSLVVESSTPLPCPSEVTAS
jgi:hypothetical protein